MRGSAVSAWASSPTITAAARVAASCALYFWLEKKVICSGPALSSEPTWRITVCALPAMRPPRREAISPRVNGPAIGITAASLRAGLAALQRLDHLVGDVDARAGEHGV